MDNLVLHAMTSRKRYKSLRHVIPDGMMGQDTNAVLAWFGAYYNVFPERSEIDLEELKSLIKVRSEKSSPESVALTLHLVDKLKTPLDSVALNGILGQLYEMDFAGRAAAAIAKYQNGEEIDVLYEVSGLADKAKRSRNSSRPDEYIDAPIEEILNDVADDKGLKFRRIQALKEHILGLQGGASVAIAARPDKGKTSFIADCLTDFAPQIVEMYGDSRPILWLNNEGSGRRILPRIYQAALKMDLNGIIDLSRRGELGTAYADAIGGYRDMIRVKDMHGASMAQIEQVIESVKPSVVVADMLANFRLGTVSTGTNKADMIEQLWQEWRELMVRNDCVGLGTVQISQEGGNMLYPPYSALKDSKTGIQGAVDVILMLGALDHPDAQSLRGLSSPKNKFAFPGKPSCFQSEVFFDGSKCKFNDG